MRYDDDLDQETDREIDREMGWQRHDDGKSAGRGAAWGEKFLFQLMRVGGWVVRLLLRLVRWVGRGLLFPVFRPFRMEWRQGEDMGEKRTGWMWFLDGVVTRLVMLPVMLMIFLIGLVWVTTHPARVEALQTPEMIGVVYKPVMLRASDGQELRGWYIPPITADDVVAQGEKLMLERWPAVVLVHGLGFSSEQYLPLAVRLHELGFAVLLLSPRGQGESGPGAVTFGLREKLDVLAGVDYLRDIRIVDQNKIGVVGCGMAGSAALAAAGLDRGIKVVVADGVWPTMGEYLESAFDAPWVPQDLMSGLYGMAFELMMRERTVGLDLHGVVGRLGHQSVLYVVHEGSGKKLDSVGGASAEATLKLASETKGHKKMVLAEECKGGVDRVMAEWLCRELMWMPPRVRQAEEVRRLLDAEVRGRVKK